MVLWLSIGSGFGRHSVCCLGVTSLRVRLRELKVLTAGPCEDDAIVQRRIPAEYPDEWC